MFATLLLLAAVQQPQPRLQAGEAARWDDGALTVTEFEVYLGRRLHGQGMGQDALRHLLQIDLVEREAKARGLAVAPADLEARMQRARDEIAKAGMDLDQFLASRSVSEAEFRKLLEDSLLHEMLARQDLQRAPDQEVTPEELTQWTEQRLNSLLQQAAAAPEGYALNAPPYVVTEQQLGRTLRSALGSARLQGYLQDYVLGRKVDTWAAAQNLSLQDAWIDEELDYQRRKAEESGVTLDGLLQAMGTSVDAVRQNAPFRTTVLLRQWAARRYDDAWFAALTPAQLTELHERFGARRQVSCILLHATDQKVDPLDLSFEEAGQELARIAADLHSAEDFAAAATQYSEDEVSRLRQGSLGWLHRRETRVDPAITAAAFAAPVGEISAPVRTAEGMVLLRVAAVEDEPGDARFRDEVRRGLLADLRNEIVAQSGLRTIYD